MTRIGLSPLIHEGRTGLLARTTNELRRDRHPAKSFFARKGLQGSRAIVHGGWNAISRILAP
jgi:hypothetical protein